MEAWEPIKSTLCLIQSAYICIVMHILHNMKLWHEIIQDIPFECIISSTHDNTEPKITARNLEFNMEFKNVNLPSQNSMLLNLIIGDS